MLERFQTSAQSRNAFSRSLVSAIVFISTQIRSTGSSRLTPSIFERLLPFLAPDRPRPFALIALELVSHPKQRAVDRGAIIAGQVHDAGFDDEAAKLDEVPRALAAFDLPRAHVMLTMRAVDENGFGQKVREWNRTEMLERWRERWAELANERLAELDIDARIDHRSLEAQGVALEPQSQIGAPANASRFGASTAKGVRPTAPRCTARSHGTMARGSLLILPPRWTQSPGKDVGSLELPIPTSCNDEANAQLTPRRANNTSVCCAKAAASA